MKKILLSALLIGLLTGCTKDDDIKSSSALVGKWQPVKMEEYSGNDLEDSEVIEQENNSCPDYTEFKSNGSMLSIDMDANCEHEEDGVGSYTFDGSNLHVKMDEEDGVYKVSSLTATSFVVESLYTEQGVTYKDIVYFKKLN